MNKFLLTACASALALTFASQAFAGQRADERAPTAAQVALTQVDFQNPSAVKAFYSRLARTARDVCDSGISDRAIRKEDAACARASMDRAVSQLSRPLLTARHQTRSETAYARGY
jgi:UrcA family protein